MGVYGYSVGPHGTIVKVDSGTVSTVLSGDGSRSVAKLLVVLDRSGSMSGAVQTIVRSVLPRVHELLGYAEEKEITILAFDDRVETIRCNRSEMKRSPLTSRGGTSLGPALLACLDVLEKDPTEPYYLVVLSDGEIGDRHQVLSIADSMSKRLASRTAPVMVSLVRAFTSAAQPDTQGLAVFGQLNSGGYLAPKDINMSMSPANTIAESIAEDLSLLGTVKISAMGGSVGRRPGELSNEIIMPVFPGVPMCILASAGVSEVSINGTVMEVITSQGTEDKVMPLLQYIESQIRQKLVIRTETCIADANSMLQWIKDVTPYLVTVAEENDDFTAQGLISRIKASASRMEKSVLNRIAQLANDSRVNNMNAARSAEFLREGLKNNALGKAVARRAANTDAEDPNVYCRASLKRLLAEKDESVENDAPQSFYSPFSTQELLSEVRSQLTEDDVEGLEAHDILQMVGCVGLSYRAQTQPCPDPWMYYIDEIYASPSSYLSQNDLWVSRMQGKAQANNVLLAPGFNRPITGVLPLTFGSPAAEGFIRKARDICQLHIGACMRDSLIRLPYDHHAVLTAGAVCAARQMYNTPNEACGRVLDAVLRDLITFTAKSKLTEELLTFRCDDPRTMMAGDVGVGTCGKPIAALFTSLLDDDSAVFVRALLGYDMYKACQQSLDGLDRRAILRSMLGVSSDKIPSAGDLFEEPEEVNFDTSIDVESIHSNEHTSNVLNKCVHGVKGLLIIQSARKFIRESLASGVETAIKSYTPLETSDIIPPGKGAVVLSLLAQAVLSKDLSDRIQKETDGKRKYRFPDVDDERLGVAYLTTLKERLSNELYEGLVQIKRRKERDVMLTDHIEELHACPFSVFCDKLTGSRDPVSQTALIPNRDCDGYHRLFEKITTDIPDSPDRRIDQVHKIYCLCLGKRPEGSEWIPFFCNGCSVRGGLEMVKKPLRDLGVIGMGFEELKDAISSGSLHVYRSSGVPNRHGHCESNPSWWARGFSSIVEYKAFLGNEEFNKYVSERAVSGRTG